MSDNYRAEREEDALRRKAEREAKAVNQLTELEYLRDLTRKQAKEIESLKARISKPWTPLEYERSDIQCLKAFRSQGLSFEEWEKHKEATIKFLQERAGRHDETNTPNTK